MKLKSLFAAIVLAISLPANAGSAYAHLYEGLQFDMPLRSVLSKSPISAEWGMA